MWRPDHPHSPHSWLFLLNHPTRAGLSKMGPLRQPVGSDVLGAPPLHCQYIGVRTLMASASAPVTSSPHTTPHSVSSVVPMCLRNSLSRLLSPTSCCFQVTDLFPHCIVSILRAENEHFISVSLGQDQYLVFVE